MSCAYFLDDSIDEQVSGNHSDFFSTAVATLTSTDGEEAISIPVKDYSNETLTVTDRNALIIALFFTVAVPIILIVLGIVIWVRRRRR